MAIEKRPASVEIVWSDDGTAIKGASYSEHWFSEEGEYLRTVGPDPLADFSLGAFEPFADIFHADLIAERDGLAAQVDTLQAAKDEAVESRDSLASQVDSLTAEIADLRNPPFNPRWLPPYSFLQRFTLAERVAILTASATDTTVGLIVTMLQTIRNVHLDNPETQQGVGYLAQIGVIEAERVAEVLADSTAEEQ